MIALLRALAHRSLYDARRAAKDAAVRLAVAAVGALLGLAGIGFLVATAYQALVRAIGPAPAGLTVGLTLILLSAICLWVAQRPRTAQPAPPMPPPIPDETPPPAGQSADLAPMAAFVAAFVLARQFPFRSDR